jgi:hypothetical protein
MSMYEVPWKDPKRMGLPRRTQILFANRQWAVTPDAIVEHHAPKGAPPLTPTALGSRRIPIGTAVDHPTRARSRGPRRRMAGGIF